MYHFAGGKLKDNIEEMVKPVKALIFPYHLVMIFEQTCVAHTHTTA